MVEYNQDDIKEMVISHHSKNRSRLQELIDYIKLSNYDKVGLASCVSTHKYAKKLQEVLEMQGMTVFSMHCKESGLDGVTLDPEIEGLTCDPLSQARFLNDNETDINIDVGLCLGHGLLFQKYSNAKVTTFIVKDPSTNHNANESLK